MKRLLHDLNVDKFIYPQNVKLLNELEKENSKHIYLQSSLGSGKSVVSYIYSIHKCLNGENVLVIDNLNCLDAYKNILEKSKLNYHIDFLEEVIRFYDYDTEIKVMSYADYCIYKSNKGLIDKINDINKYSFYVFSDLYDLSSFKYKRMIESSLDKSFMTMRAKYNLDDTFDNFVYEREKQNEFVYRGTPIWKTNPNYLINEKGNLKSKELDINGLLFLVPFYVDMQNFNELSGLPKGYIEEEKYTQDRVFKEISITI